MKNTIIRLALTAAALAGILASPKAVASQLTANFGAGNTSSQTDGYPGMAGAGWLSGWTSNKGSSSYISFINTVAGAAPLYNGGNYLSVAVANSSTGADYGGAVTRQFDTAFLDHAKRHRIVFDFRGLSNINQASSDTNSQYAFFGSTANNAWGLDANTTWGIGATYSGGSLQWRYYNGSSSMVATGIPYAAGATYRFAIDIDPAARTYAFSISDGTTIYYSPANLAFRNAATGVNRVFFGTKVDKDHSGSIQFLLDSLSVSPESAAGFPAEICARFSAGTLTTHPDGYAGIAGAGWLDAWTPRTSGASFSNTVTGTAPLNEGGNCLNANLSFNGTSTTGVGAVGRKFDSAVVSGVTPYTVSFDLRLNTPLLGSSDKLVIFGDTSTSYAFGTGATNTFCIQGNYNSGSPAWYVQNGARDGSSGATLATGLELSQGTVYTFVVNVDPGSRSWSVSIDDGSSLYQSGMLGFRAAPSPEGGNSVYFGAIVRNTTGTIGYSIDNISIRSAAPSAKDWPTLMVPSGTGVAAHFNTKVNFAMPENAPALDLARDAGIRFVRYCMPWQDVERTQGVYNFTTGNLSYTPGYLSGESAFVSRGFRPILCLAFTNTLYGLAQNTPITSAAGLAAYENYCYAMAYQFRNDNPVFEIWNEPNLSGFGGYTAAQYMTLLQHAVSGVLAGWRAGRDTPDLPNPIILGPAVANSWAPGNFFDQCLDAGLLDIVDGLSYHPYLNYNPDPARRIPEVVGDSTALLRAELVRRGKSHMPIVFTEWGWSTGAFTYEVTEAAQAKFAARQVLAGYYNRIAINCLYSLEDARNDNDRSLNDKHYGLFKTVGADYQKIMTAKPAVGAVAAVYEALDGFCYVQRVNMGNTAPLNSSKDWCLIFWNPATKTAKAAVWTIETAVTKTTPNLQPLLNLTGPASTNFTDSPVFIDLPGYHP